MFLHNFKYSLKVLLRKKVLIFWTIAFPILLGTLFNMAFSDIENNEKLDIIDIAIVDNDDFNNNLFYTESFKVLSDVDNEDRLFDITYTSLENSKNMLENKEITGYVFVNGEDVNIVVNSNGINETILKNAVDEIISSSKTFGLKSGEEVKLKDISNENLSYTMIEFYTLIAMSCLYGGILSMAVINEKLANQKSVGKRTSISPAGKGKILVGSLLASFIVQLLGVFLLFLYTIFVLKVDYGNNLLLVELLAVVGSFAGLCMGVVVGTLFKTNENTKTGILISITMLRKFFIWNDGNYDEIYC